MTIKYSHSHCYVFVSKLRKLFDDADFVRLWSLFIRVVPYLDTGTSAQILDDPEIVLDLQDEKQLILFMLREWTQLSLWEMQAVLYMLIPYIIDVARRNARLVTQYAREKEPI